MWDRKNIFAGCGVVHLVDEIGGLLFWELASMANARVAEENKLTWIR